MQSALSNLYKKYVPGSVELICEAMQDGQQVERLKTILPITNLNLVCLTFLNTFILHTYLPACLHAMPA